ncbi:MAG: M20/M25/M40 family metallo-hydrolase [Candidatus Desulfofervidus auxilii]|nr:M20/M25/M40 family metallo-hydrolase [Candidatus Desulfofervidus auxilii]
MELDIKKIKQSLWHHLYKLAEEIGERSIYKYSKLKETANYIISCFKELDYQVETQQYDFMGKILTNIIAMPRCLIKNYIICAHYDSVAGSPGADDNASGIAVILELARLIREIDLKEVPVKFIAFTAEEPPLFGTHYMGSYVYAERAKANKEKIDGVICLEMVGYFTNKEKSQKFPFPLQFFGYPRIGNFIAVIGNRRSKELVEKIVSAFKLNPALPVESLTVPGNGYILYPVRLSDHANFWDKGYKAIMLTDTAFYRNPNYHTKYDKLETLNLDMMTELVKSLMYFILKVQ